MTELEILRRRRELVMLSADVQRATIVHRIQSIERNPGRMLFGIAANATRVFAARRIGLAFFGLARRMFH